MKNVFNAYFGDAGPMISNLLVMGVIFGFMYFFLIRPQQKKRKEEKKLRNQLQIGDEVTTIGGIIGKIVNLKEDSIVIESGTEKIYLKRWAISSCTSNNKVSS